MGQHHNSIYIGAAALAAVAGFGIYHVQAQDDDALDALMRDLGDLMQQPAAIEAVEIVEINADPDPVVDAEKPAVILPFDLLNIEPLVIEPLAVEPFELLAVEAEPEPVPVVVEVADVVEVEPVVVVVNDPPASIVVDAAPSSVAPAAPAPDMDPDAETILKLHGLRVNMEKEHAYQNLVDARASYKAGNYKRAQEQYDLAALFLPADDYAAEEEARVGLQEALYQQAVILYRNKSFEDALKTAQLAQDKGHVKAGRLVAEIQRDIDVPPTVEKAYDNPKNSQAYLTKRTEIEEHLRNGHMYFSMNELDRSLLEAEIILRKDPYNTSALELRARIANRKQAIHEIETRGTRELMLDDIARIWTPQERYAVTTAEFGIGVIIPQREESISMINRRKIEEKMGKIIIPETNFRDAKIQDVKTFFEEASREYDDQNLPADQRGVNFALILPESVGGGARQDDPFNFGAGGSNDGTARVNFSARYTSLLSILNTVMEITRMKYNIRDNFVTIMPINYIPQGADLFTRSYVVNDTLLSVVTTVSGELGARRTEGPFGFQPAVGGTTTDDTDSLKTLFQDLGVPFPLGTSITYVPSIGRLRVTNTPENLAKFDQVLSELNVQTRMVEIEARFVEVGVETLNSLGFEWSVDGTFGLFGPQGRVGTVAGLSGANINRRAGGNLIGITGGTSAKSVNGSWPNQMLGNISAGNRFLTNQGGIPGLTANAITDNLFNLFTTIKGQDVGVILHMLSQKKGTDLLSAPKVLTRPGMPAVMKVTREFIYPRSFNVDSFQSNGDNNNVQNAMPYVEPSDFNFDDPTDVGVILEVTPEVSSEGQLITMMLNPRVVELSEWIDYGYDVPYSMTSQNALGVTTSESALYHLKMEVPIFSRREVQANISIYNGATVVMGGMITEARTKIEDKVPFFGDIPYLGQFFRSTIDHSEKRNLLIFVTARLVDPAGRPVQVTEYDRTTIAAPTVN